MLVITTTKKLLAPVKNQTHKGAQGHIAESELETAFQSAQGGPSSPMVRPITIEINTEHNAETRYAPKSAAPNEKEIKGRLLRGGIRTLVLVPPLNSCDEIASAILASRINKTLY